MRAALSQILRRGWGRWTVALSACVLLMTLLEGLRLAGVTASGPGSYLQLGVLVAALVGGLWPAIAAWALTGLYFTWYLVPFDYTRIVMYLVTVLVAALLVVVLNRRAVRLARSEARRVQSEAARQRLAALFDNANDAILVYPLTDSGPGRLIEVNEAAVRLYGYSREELLQRTVFDIINPGDVRPKIYQQLRERGSLLVEHRHRTRDGRLLPVEVHAHLFDLEGRPTVLSVCRDLTERRRAQEAVRESEGRLMEVLERIGEAFAAVDADDRITYINPQGQRFANLPPDQLQGRDLFDVFADLRGTPFETAYRQAVESQVAVRVESIGPTTGRWFETAIYPSSRGVTLFARDVDDLKRAQSARDEVERRFREMADHAPVLIWISGLDRRREYANKPWLDFTGRTMEEEAGDGWTTNIHPDDRDACLEVYTQAFSRHEPFETEYRLRRHDGQYRWVLDHGTPRFEEGGRFIGYIGSCIDITDRRERIQTLAFLLRLNRTLQPLQDGAALMATTARMLGEYLQADRCAYARIADDEDHFTITGDHTRGTFSIVGDYRLQEFGPQVRELLRSNEPLIVEDVERDPLTRDHAGVYQRTGIRAIICVPLHKEGRLVAAMAVHQSAPRPWKPAEIDLVRLAVNGCWEALERARVSQSLRESEERFRAIVSQATVGVAEMDAKGRFTYVNEGFSEITGYTLDELRGRTVAEITHPDDWPLNADLYQRTFDTGEAFILDKRYIRQDGGIVWVNKSVSPLRDQSGRIRGVLGMAIDVTRRHQQEAALRQSEQRLKLALETGRFGTWERDLATDTLITSEQCRLNFGREPAEPLTVHDAIESIHPDDRAFALATVRRIIDACADGDLEYRIHCPDGSTRWLASRIRCEAGPDRKPARLIGINMDVTQRKQAEAELKALNETLEQRVRERTMVAEIRAEQLRVLAIQLTQAEQRERRRLAQALHDSLQQLLVAAKLRLSGLQSRLEAPDASVNAVQDLLDQSIAMSRSLSMQLSPPILHDRGLIPALDWLSRWMQEKHELAVTVNCDEDAEPRSEEIRTLLFEAARELLFNVVKHAGVKEASVSLARLGEDQVHMIIEDRGSGFAADDSDMTQPAGFGLMSVRERLSFLGGSLEVKSNAGEGTRILLTAPRDGLRPAEESRVAPASGSHPWKNAPQAEPRSDCSEASAIRVLLADDHRILRQGLVSLLEEEPGIQVVGEASDGAMAVEMAGNLSPDVVVMDVTMPRMSGIEATRRIKQKMPAVRVIGLSMHSATDMASALHEAGASAYLTKGGPANDLIRAIRGDGDGKASDGRTPRLH